MLERATSAPLLLLAGLWAAASLPEPMGWDQGIFAWIGGAIVRGETPYRDVWDQKGPLTFAPYALMHWLTGGAMWGIRVFDLCVLGAGCIAAERLARRFAGPRAGVYAMASLVIGYAQFRCWNTAQPDGWAALLHLMVVEILTHDEERPTRRAFGTAGALVGLTSLFKPFFAMALILPGLCLWFAWKKLSKRERLGSVTVLLLSFLAPIALVIAWFAERHALGALFDGYIRYNAENAHSALGWGASAAQIYFYLFTTPAVGVALPMVAYAIASLYRLDGRGPRLLAVWLALEFVCIFLQRRFYGYHWHLFFPPLVVLTVIGVGRFWQSPAGRTAEGRALAIVAAALPLALLSAPVIHDIHHGLRLALGRISLVEYYAEFDADGGTIYTHDGFSVARDLRVASFLRDHTEPGEPAFVWSDPFVYFLANRPGAARVSIGRPYIDWASPSRRAALASELLTTLSGSPPRYIVMLERSLSTADTDDPLNVSVRFSALAAFLEDHYEKETQIDDFLIYRRRAP